MEEPEAKTQRPDMEELKCDLNNFCFSRLPDGMTLAEFEVFTCDIMTLFDAIWDKVVR